MNNSSNISFENINLIVFEEYSFMRDMLVNIFKAFGVRKAFGIDNTLDLKNKLQQSVTEPTNHKVDLLVIDLVPPNNHGFYFLQWMRSHQDPALRYLPVIFTTSDPREKSIKMIRDIGSNEILLKPYTADKIAEYFLYAINKPRPFIESTQYVGPDRRRTKKLSNNKPERRTITRKEVEIVYEDNAA